MRKVSKLVSSRYAWTEQRDESRRWGASGRVSTCVDTACTNGPPVGASYLSIFISNSRVRRRNRGAALYQLEERAIIRSCAFLAALALSLPVLAAEPVALRDLPYAEPKTARQTLDVYSPAEGKNHPIVFWIHGGGWQRGDKSEVDHKPKAFTERGYVFVSTNYRFVPNVTIQQMAGDVAKSIRYARDHAREFGGDPDRFIIAGHSAGAQLAALVCTDDRYLKAEGLSLSFIKGCIPVDGDTYDVPLQIATVEERRANIYRMKFGNEASQKELSPITHVAKGKRIPAVLIIHVAAHPETKLQSERLVKVLTETGLRASAFPAVGTDHVKLNADLGLPEDKATKSLFEFVANTLKR